MSVHIKRLPSVIAVTAAVSAVAVPVASAADRPALAFRATAPVARTTAATPIVLGGLSQAGWPVVLAISRNTRRLRLAVIGLEMSCTSGDSFATRDVFANLAIARNGSVHAVRTIAPVGGSSVSITGGAHAITGTLNRRRMTFSGTWHLHLDFQGSNGQTDHCDSGRVNFGAIL